MSDRLTAALYARISTSDGRQAVENQLAEMRRYCARRGWVIAAEYVDELTGADGVSTRGELARMLEDGRRGHFDMLLVFALDRLTREGVLKAFEYVRDLKAAGVEFASVTEPQFQTSGFAGDLFLAIAAWMAQQERTRICERVKAGLDRARAEGIRLGRPRAHVDLDEMKRRYIEGASLREIAETMNLSRSTVERASRDWRQKRRREVTA